MTTFLTILGLGFLLGLRHATDADHIAAISTITANQKNIKSSTIIGVLWGIGHSAMVSLIGILIIFFSLNISAKVGMVFEFFVGIMLVVLGAINIYNLIKIPIIHKHAHSHNKKVHSHLHFHFIRPILVGSIHGLAGSAAIALLILGIIHNSIDAVFYLIIFNIGVIVGMMIITTFIGTSFAIAKKKINNLHKYLVLGSGIVSIIFGIYIIYARTLKV